jgi:hypothetical protein
MKTSVAGLIAALLIPLAASAGGSLRAEVVDARGRATWLAVSSFTIGSGAGRRPSTATLEVDDGTVFRESLLGGDPVDVRVEGCSAPIKLDRWFVKSWPPCGPR